MAQVLTEDQSAALFDILTHYDTYAEIREFRLPGSLKQYGPPFNHEKGKASTSPALQILVSRYLLTLPGLRDLPEDFWKVQCHDVIDAFEEAELSESYDRGSIGSRKTLATAISVLIEHPVRGSLGGFGRVNDPNTQYDLTSTDDLTRAFANFLDQAVYGDVLEEMVKKTAETDQLSEHSSLTQAVHEYVLVNIASFMHYTLILSPKGQYLLKLIENMHKMIPYMLIRQTLKIGNVASMINAMVKLGLAKVSFSSFTNWMGLTNIEDEGMNLLQSIMSNTLTFDIKDLESRASKIEKSEDGPSKEQLKAIKDFLGESREEHEKVREESQRESISIVIAILQNSSVSTDFTDAMHKAALDYLSVQLSIRDRKEILRILCHSVPDHFTTSIRSLVNAYEPVIRQMHKAIDLSETVYDAEVFLKDMIKLAKVQSPGKDGTKTSVPTVGDFIQLLRKHQYSCHKFFHQCCKNGKKVTSWYLEWAKTAANFFRRREEPEDGKPVPQLGAGDMTNALNKLFASLDEPTQKKVLPILDAQTAYIDTMHTSSRLRFESVLRSPPSDNPAITKILRRSHSHHRSLSRSNSRNNSRPSSRSRPTSRSASRTSSRGSSPDHHARTPGRDPVTPSTPSKLADSIDPNDLDVEPAQPTDPDAPPPTIESNPGPGAYLSRWQDLLSHTPITPLTPHGKVQSALSKSIVKQSATDVDGETLVQYPTEGSGAEKVTQKTPADNKDEMDRPDVKPVIDALAGKFRDLIARRTLDW